LKPLNSSGRLVCEDLDQIGSRLVSRRLEGIVVELLDAVLDSVLDLCSGEGTVDSGGCFGRVTTEETWVVGYLIDRLFLQDIFTLFIQNNDISTGQVDGVRSTQAGHWEDGQQAIAWGRGRVTYIHHQQQ